MLLELRIDDYKQQLDKLDKRRVNMKKWLILALYVFLSIGAFTTAFAI